MKGQAKEPATLYLVATPLGNLEDLSFRALRVFREVAWIAAEDTRTSAKLMDSQGISASLISFHEHSGAGRIEALVGRLIAGESGAYISDAGTPGICDPGAPLVRAAAEAGIRVVPVPGASAPVALLSVSGFDGSQFTFRGFFPRERADRKAWAESAEASGGLQVFFESPHRIKDCLEFLGERFPAVPLVLGRELTKKFETIHRGTCQEVAARLNLEEPRGEYVLAMNLAAPDPRPTGLREPELAALMEELAALGAGQKILLRVGLSHGATKNTAYAMALKALGKN
ncbi:MAG: 16S rRNA (cytidine(1402)-2'-O)-methyltransferase [Proteobacteria bacterium]|nr:MAG: 16S rRNA (cytidine(1402)-2'-O)-methyltransferase [Pseudomonadota bacterium]